MLMEENICSWVVLQIDPCEIAVGVRILYPSRCKNPKCASGVAVGCITDRQSELPRFPYGRIIRMFDVCAEHKLRKRSFGNGSGRTISARYQPGITGFVKFLLHGTII